MSSKNNVAHNATHNTANNTSHSTTSNATSNAISNATSNVTSNITSNNASEQIYDFGENGGEFGDITNVSINANFPNLVQPTMQPFNPDNMQRILDIFIKSVEDSFCEDQLHHLIHSDDWVITYVKMKIESVLNKFIVDYRTILPYSTHYLKFWHQLIIFSHHEKLCNTDTYSDAKLKAVNIYWKILREKLIFKIQLLLTNKNLQNFSAPSYLMIEIHSLLYLEKFI